MTFLYEGSFPEANFIHGAAAAHLCPAHLPDGRREACLGPATHIYPRLFYLRDLKNYTQRRTSIPCTPPWLLAADDGGRAVVEAVRLFPGHPRPKRRAHRRWREQGQEAMSDGSFEDDSAKTKPYAVCHPGFFLAVSTQIS
jgi:hypothetical protein